MRGRTGNCALFGAADSVFEDELSRPAIAGFPPITFFAAAATQPELPVGLNRPPDRQRVRLD